MRSVLLIFAALVSLIYAADPVGTFQSGCVGGIYLPTSPIELHVQETVTLSDGHQFEKEQMFYIDACTTPLLIARVQGTFSVTGDASNVVLYPAMTPVATAQGINVDRSHFFVTVLSADIAPTIKDVCGLSTVPTAGVAFDIHTTGCLGMGILSNNTCPTFYDVYNVAGSNLQFGLQFLNVTTCSPLARQNLLNPLPYNALAAPTLASGKYELGCTQFATSPMALWNTYFLEITATSGTAGKYSLTSNTFNAATCAQSALFSTTVLSATYTVDGYAVVQNNMLDGKRPLQLNLVFTSKTATPKTALSVGGLKGYCPDATFTLNQATELNVIGCIGLGFPASSDPCASKHFDVVQEKLDGSGFYPGGATGFNENCSKDKRVETVSAKDWTTYVEPTATPTPTSSSSSLAANVLLLISLLVFVLHF